MNKSLVALFLIAPAALHAQAPVAPVRQSGTVKSVDANGMTLTTAAGEVMLSVPKAATVLQLAPGSTDLKSAQPATLADLQPGDKVLATARPETPTIATRVIVIKATAIAARNTASQEEWQKQGTSGIVKSIEAPSITIARGTGTVGVVTTPKTIFRRYAMDSIKFEDARPGGLAQIQTGDQLSVRGPRSADGSTITADEVVTGSFENLSGVLKSADATTSTVTFMDLATKREVTVNLTANTDIRKLPAQASAAFSNRTAGAAGRGPGAGPGAGAAAAAGPGGRIAGGGGERTAGGEGVAGRPRNAGMDLSRMLPHLPTETIADLKAGDTVMIVASQGRGSELTGITVLTGVEQILSSTSNTSQPITLSPWNLGAPEGGGGQ